jgi:hypothetical protein
MLAQNFMSAEQLKIEPDMHNALIKLLGMMERGEIEHMPVPDGSYDIGAAVYRGPIDAAKFNMRKVVTEHECGTVMCILGYTEAIMGHKCKSALNGYPLRLFAPTILDLDWNKLTVEQCTTAVARIFDYRDNGLVACSKKLKLTM